MRGTLGRLRAASAGLALVLAGVNGLSAEPAAKEDCEKARVEQAELVAGGVKERMQQGPEQAKARLSAAQLKEVERYIALDETLEFRCGLASTRLQLPMAEEDAVPTSNAKAPATPKARGRPKAEAKAQPDKAPAGPVVADPVPPVKAKAQPKPKPKARPDDAYRPPAAEPASNSVAGPGAPKN
jgi:hypothetical protein